MSYKTSYTCIVLEKRFKKKARGKKPSDLYYFCDFLKVEGNSSIDILSVVIYIPKLSLN